MVPHHLGFARGGEHTGDGKERRRWLGLRSCGGYGGPPGLGKVLLDAALHGELRDVLGGDDRLLLWRQCSINGMAASGFFGDGRGAQSEASLRE